MLPQLIVTRKLLEKWGLGRKRISWMRKILNETGQVRISNKSSGLEKNGTTRRIVLPLSTTN